MLEESILREKGEILFEDMEITVSTHNIFKKN
jgi:hypothetical protein